VFGAPYVERTLARHLPTPGDRKGVWQANEMSVVDLPRLVQGLTTPARVMVGKPAIPYRWVEAVRPQLVKPAPNRFATRGR